MRSIALDDLLQREHPGASFHDAWVEGYYFDARSRSLEFYVQIAFCPGGGNPRYLPGVLTFSDVLSFHVEGPGSGGSTQRPEGLWLTAEGPVESLSRDVGVVPAAPSAADRAFHHYLYFSDVNAFIFIAGLGVEFAWREVADQRRGGAV